jgi:hypothetical protein
MEFLLFSYYVQKFSAYNFLWVHFFTFFLMDSNSSSNFALYDTRIKFFAFFLTLQSNAEETGKKLTYLINV